TGLVDGAQRADAHGTGWELPEIGHQPGMRIGAQTVAADFAAEVLELLLADAAFQKGARIDAGGRVRLEIHQIAAIGGIGTAEEVVEADLEDLRRGGIAGDMPA